MPTRIFAITAARETVTLDNEGRAELSVTLTAERDSIEVPNALGETVGEARVKFHSLHLEDFIDPHAEHRYTVYEQSPEPGRRIALGARVTIWAHFRR